MTTAITRYDFIVLGADGMQGQIVCRDLLERGYKVFMADLYRVRVGALLKQFGPERAFFTFVDLRDVDLTIKIIEKSGANVVINCAEGDWDLNVYKACLHTRSHCLDLGSHISMTKEQLGLGGEFQKRGLTAITGCGSVPGIGNVMLRHAARKFDSIKSIDVGFAWDSNVNKFVVPFSIQSIFEEFTAPAPVLKNGRFIHKKPLKAMMVRRFKSIGLQRSFIVDHPETYTFYHYYKEKGLQNIRFYAGFPYHSFKTIQTLIDLGFNGVKPVRVNGSEVIPDEFVTQLLKRLRIPRGYKEKENLWVEITGKKNRKKKTILMECIVPTLKGWEKAGCNIDTGFPVSIMAEMIKRGVIRKRGSFAPEGVVPEQPFFKELRKRKMVVYENGQAIN